MPKSKSRKLDGRAPTTAYCVKCKSNVVYTDGAMSATKNGQPMIRGTCQSCGGKVCRFVSKQ